MGSFSNNHMYLFSFVLSLINCSLIDYSEVIYVKYTMIEMRMLEAWTLTGYDAFMQ